MRVCEHLPQLARRLDKLAVVRSVSHKYNSHNPYGVMTGFDGGQDQTDYFARPTNHPSVPSVCQVTSVVSVVPRRRRDRMMAKAKAMEPTSA